jgi:hypothetical protein
VAKPGLDRLPTRRPERPGQRHGRENRPTRERIDTLQYAIIVVGGGLFAAFVAFLAAILGLIVTLIVLHS